MYRKAVSEVFVPNSPAVLLLDDGELDDVQEILENLGVAFGRVRGGAIVSDMPPPRHLLVSTPRRIEAVASHGGDELSRIVVVNEDSPSLRTHLRDIGFDFLVRRPVHPEALRLLLMHCLYRGEERRREPRVPMGLEISFDTGVASRRATLADLSSRGCRLLAGFAIDPGKRITVQIPESLGAAEPLAIEGRVLRMSFDPQLGDGGLYAAAVEFENLSPDTRNELEWIIEDKSAGPPSLNDANAPAGDGDGEADELPVRRGRRRAFRETVSPSCPPDPRSEDSATHDIEPVSPTPLGIPVDVKLAPPDAPDEEPEEETVIDRPIPQLPAQPDAPLDDEAGERRTTERRPYPEKVPAFGTRALRVLVGRDLSVGGMRIETQSELEIGDRLHLAIYGSPGDEPFLVWGTLVRKDGERGMAVEFDEVHEVVAEQLEKLIASLPSVESLHDDEAAAMGTVLTEVLDR